MKMTSKDFENKCGGSCFNKDYVWREVSKRVKNLKEITFVPLTGLWVEVDYITVDGKKGEIRIFS